MSRRGLFPFLIALTAAGSAVHGQLPPAIDYAELECRSPMQMVVQSSHEASVMGAAYSPDGRFLASGGYDNTVKLWNVENGKVIRNFRGHTGIVTDVAFGPDGRLILSAGDDAALKLWSRDGELLRSFTGHASWVEEAVFSPDGRFLAGGGSYQGVRLWSTDGQHIRTLAESENTMQSIAFSPDGRTIASGGYGRRVRVWSLEGELVREMAGHSNCVTAVLFDPGGRSIWSAGMDGRILHWDAAGRCIEEISSLAGDVTTLDLTPGGRYVLYSTTNAIGLFDRESGERCSLAPSGEDWIMFSPDGCFDASRSGGALVAVVKGMTDFAVDQFAVRANLPDLMLSRMGLGDPELPDYFYGLYRKRLRRLGITEEKLSADLHVPEARILEARRDGKHLTVAFELSDDRCALSLCNIYVNDVPLLGAFGRSLDGRAPAAIRLEHTLELGAGENKVEISCLNEKGAESYRALTSAFYGGEVHRDLYFLGFGVSEYGDPRLNLRYADKDARDLAALLGSAAGEHFHRVHVKTLLNREVTPQSIRQAKTFLRGAGVDDTLVLFIAGHGIHDTDPGATYYYLTHGADVQNLAGTCAPFDLIEELVHDVAPRSKLFLMDTCESREVEPEAQQRYYAAAEHADLSARAARGFTLVVTSASQQTAAPARTWLYEKDRYTANDLLRRSGAIVFSSSKGGAFSYESDRIENGFFTDAIIRCLTGWAADGDWDGLISTDELRRFVSLTVAEATGGLQHPTVDRDNTYQKFALPVIQW